MNKRVVVKRKMFTHEERHFLLKLIHANKAVIENKESDVVNQVKKKMCWEHIAEMFNSQETHENKVCRPVMFLFSGRGYTTRLLSTHCSWNAPTAVRFSPEYELFQILRINDTLPNRLNSSEAELSRHLNVQTLEENCHCLESYTFGGCPL